jgi:hypothetical protein
MKSSPIVGDDRQEVRPDWNIALFAKGLVDADKWSPSVGAIVVPVVTREVVDGKAVS